jgi:hypothetical protein
MSLLCKYLFKSVGPVTEMTNNNNVGIEKNPKMKLKALREQKIRLGCRKDSMRLFQRVSNLQKPHIELFPRFSLAHQQTNDLSLDSNLYKNYSKFTFRCITLNIWGNYLLAKLRVAPASE